MGPQETRHVLVRPVPLVALGLSTGWTAAAFLAGGFFSPTVGALALAAGSALVLLAALHGLRRPSVGVVALGFLALWTASSFLWGASHAGDAALLPLGYSATLWLAEQSDKRRLLRALRVALLLVSGAALTARLLALGPTAGGTSHRLQWPVTYSNGLGLVAATGLLVWLLLPTRVPALGWAAATGGLTLHHTYGGLGRPLVFIHGLGSSGYIEWRFNLDYFARTNRVFAPDLPGYGKSDKPPAARYGIPYFARTIERYLESRHLRQATIIGTSMGGRIAL